MKTVWGSAYSPIGRTGLRPALDRTGQTHCSCHSSSLHLLLVPGSTLSAAEVAGWDFVCESEMAQVGRELVWVH